MLTPALERAEAAVDAAYALHDESYAPPADRLAAMQAARAEAEAVIASAASLAGQSKDSAVEARLQYLRGKAATCGPDGRGSAEAEQLLAVAVKLDPSLDGAWNAIGECYWQRGDLEAARGCFLGALAHRRSAASLCHLSMLLRLIARRSAPDEARAGVLESLSLAREAVRLEASQGAWFSLGNAQLAVYNTCTAGSEELHRAGKAFTQASRVGGGSSEGAMGADLAMNHGLSLFLLEALEPAMEAYATAHSLDPSVGADRMRHEVWEYARRVSDALGASGGGGGLKQRRAPLPEPPPPSAAEDTHPRADVQQLRAGDNPGVRLRLRLLAPLPESPQRLHRSFAAADRSGAVVALALFGHNLPPALRGPAAKGATVEVEAPSLVRASCEPPVGGGEGQRVAYDCLLSSWSSLRVVSA